MRGEPLLDPCSNCACTLCCEASGSSVKAAHMRPQHLRTQHCSRGRFVIRLTLLRTRLQSAISPAQRPLQYRMLGRRVGESGGNGSKQRAVIVEFEPGYHLNAEKQLRSIGARPLFLVCEAALIPKRPHLPQCKYSSRNKKWYGVHQPAFNF
jgi:hypothetical protein